MAKDLDGALRSTISYAAFSASLAFSLTTLADDASAQQQQRQPNQGSGQNVSLDPIDVAGQAPAEGEGSYTVQTASSPKQTAPLLNLPQTVTVVPQAIIQETGARDLTEVLRNTPGITFDAGENGFGTSMTNFKLRGFDTSGSVFIDGSRDNGTYARDIFNTERVEVFKGAAADNGRGGAGGYVNMVTKTPSLQNFFSGDLGYGFDQYDSGDRRRGTVDLNYVVTPNTAFRLNAVLEDSGVAGREVAENKVVGVAPSIAFGLGTHARAIFAYEHLSRNDLPDWGIPAHAIEGMARYSPSVARISRDSFYGLASDFDDTTADSLLARFEYDFSNNATISNQTRWARVDRTARFSPLAGNPFGAATAPCPPCLPANLPATLSTQVATQTLFYDRENTTLTNLTNYSAEFFTGAFKHHLSMGVEFSREDSDAGRFGPANPSPGSTPLFNPNPNRVGGAPFVLWQTAGVKVDTAAAYLYDTIELSPQWQLTGGLRAEHYKVRISSRLTPEGASQPTPPSIGGNGFEDSETTLGGKIGLVYKPASDVSYYASAGLSHRPPGSYLSGPDISRTGDNAFPGLIPGADPVRSINYEVGVKRDFFGGRLQTTLALFQTEQRVPLQPDPEVDPIFYSDEIVRGIELGVAGHLTDRWKVFGGLLLLDSERKTSRALDAALMAASPNDFRYLGVATGGNPFIATSVNGDELAFTPRISANLWTTYLVPNTNWTVGGGLQYVGSSWLGRPDDANRVIPNGVFGKLPAYFLAHLMASYEVRKGVNIQFNVDNVFDKTYAVSTNWPGQRVMLGAPRTYRVSANFKF